MKFNIYIKILTAFFVIFLILVLAFFKYLKSVETKIVVNAGKTMSQGLLISCVLSASLPPSKKVKKNRNFS